MQITLQAALTRALPIALLLAASPQAATADTATQIVFTDNAVSAAGQWVRQNNDGIAIAVRLGSDTPISPRTIEQALRSDFAEHGVHRLRFYFERGGNGGSSAVYQSSNHVWGPFGLADARNQVGVAARQLRFEINRGLN